MRPPTRLAPAHRPPSEARSLVGQGAAERAALVQCLTCGNKATGRVRGRRVLSMQMRATYNRGQWHHHGCGGRVVAFDIEADS
mgnify:CR=1 FL=1